MNDHQTRETISPTCWSANQRVNGQNECAAQAEHSNTEASPARLLPIIQADPAREEDWHSDATGFY